MPSKSPRATKSTSDAIATGILIPISLLTGNESKGSELRFVDTGSETDDTQSINRIVSQSTALQAIGRASLAVRGISVALLVFYALSFIPGFANAMSVNPGT